MSKTSLEGIRGDFDRIARLVADEPEPPDRYDSFLLKQLPNRCARVLEIGCGAGRLARAIARRGTRVTAVDVSPEMIRLARRRTGNDARIEFVCGDFAEHCSGAETYDGVVSVATLHHLPAAPAIARMRQLVEPGGVLVIHDLRSIAGALDWLRSGAVGALNGDALWWVFGRARQSPALRDAWREHGFAEHYLTMAEVRRLRDTTLPGARVYRHPLWRYTVVWRR